ncbi:MAG: division/cell wall cluster transcriptional repressor MraZ [Termitinemataceae bacterium]|nr:MAG: division/cell wall cluster transcriptional repressor MraZ [Termitinemataceae bacterium]
MAKVLLIKLIRRCINNIRSGKKWRKREKRGSDLLNGGFNNTLDEKGRLSFPSALKEKLSGSSLVITRGIDGCLWAFPPQLWLPFATKLEQSSPMLKDARRLQRHFLGWASEAEIDKSSRLSIPQSLRTYAGLVKDCVVIGVGQRIEIWDAATYEKVNGGEDGVDIADSAEQFAEIF